MPEISLENELEDTSIETIEVDGNLKEVELSSSIKESTEESFVYPDTKNEIAKLCLDSRFGCDIKTITGKLVYQFAPNSEERNIPLEINLNYDDEGHSIKLFGHNFYKSDFMTLYDSFEKIHDMFLKEMFNVIDAKKEQFQEQIEMFPELEKSSLSFMEITLPIYSAYKDDTISLKLQVCGSNSENIRLKLTNKIALHKADIYFLYSKFEQIIKRFTGES